MRRSAIGLFLLLGLFTACFRPNYERPEICLPPAWRIAADEESTLCNMRWWEELGDPILDHLITMALHNNQDLQLAMSRVFEYCARLGITNSALLPTVNGNLAYQRGEITAAFPTGIPTSLRTASDMQGSLNLSWLVDFWGQTHAASEAACADLWSKIQARRGVVISVVSAVANAYITLRGLDAQLAISKQTLKSRKESLKLAIDRFQLGETSELEVKQAEAEVEDAAIRVLEYERDIPLQEDLLSILLGEYPHGIERGRDIWSFPYPCAVPAGLPSDLLTRRPDVASAEENLISMNAQITVAYTNFFPQLTLTSMAGSQSMTIGNFLTGLAQTWQIGIAAVQPIFNAGLNCFQLKQAQAQWEEAKHAYIQTVLQALREVNDALIAYQKNRELVKEHEIQVKVLKDYLRLATLRYEEGEVDYLNVLDAERYLFAAELQYAQAQADSFTALIQLYASLGGGWVDEADSLAISEFCP